MPNRHPLAAPLTGVFLLLAAMVAPSLAHADYGMPPLESGFSSTITTIVDATVDRYDDKGVAHITVHALIRGDKKPASLYGVQYTCFGGTLQHFGVKAGKRYIFLLHEAELFEERSHFEVTPGKDGGLSVDFGPSYQTWLGLPSPTMTRKRALEALTALSEKHPFEP